VRLGLSQGAALSGLSLLYPYYLATIATMATIRQRQRGVWEVRAFTGRDDRGRPTQTSRTVRGSRRDAERVAAGLKVRPADHSAGRTVGDVMTAWFEHNTPTWAASSARDQASRAELVKGDQLARVPISRLTVADVERWHARLRRAGLSDSGLKNRHQALRAALTQAVRWGWLGSNPASLARLRIAKRSPRGSMTTAEVQKVLAAGAQLGSDVELALRLAALTGARRSELAGLRWDDVVDGRLRIDSSVAVLRSKGAGPVRIDAPTKTANSRTVTLDSATLALIDALEAERRPLGEWMFSVVDGPAAPDRIGYWWSRARASSGIDKAWRLHDLRHFSATQAIAGGHDVRTVAGRLGHANPAMTLRTYAHVVQTADDAVTDTLSALLDGSAEPRSKASSA
jgi:integrase